ncbi:MAG: arsenosugar biosynthesis arsenite methyltransferase ArsM [Phycisphaerales bacterium]
MSTDYLSTVQDVYRKAAEAPEVNLCCVPAAQRYLPELSIPRIMHDMNYGCGSTVHLQDMRRGRKIAYVGVGGGLEALELAYFSRAPGSVIAVDPVAEMREAARRNLEEAARTNPWFDPSFVDIRDGNALDLPLEDSSVDVAAQNCLFNIFKTADETGDLERALSEMHRVLRKNGRLVMSDPITTAPIPESLRQNDVLRAQCISGCLSYDAYMKKIVDAGFGAIEVRARRPYRLLSAAEFPELDGKDVLLESVDVAAFKVNIPNDGACVFTGRTAIYSGDAKQFDDGRGHVLLRGVPLAVCDKTANALDALGRDDIVSTPSTWHYGGGGCC